jgi:hypothetical protein
VEAGVKQSEDAALKTGCKAYTRYVEAKNEDAGLKPPQRAQNRRALGTPAKGRRYKRAKSKSRSLVSPA